MTGICMFFLIFLTRYSAYLSTYFYDVLNHVGIMVNNHIYTPVTVIQHNSAHWIDLVILGKHQHHVHVYSLIYGDYFTIQLHHVPVGHKLVHLHQEQKKAPPYMSGTPFKINEGELILYKRKRRGLGFITEKVNQAQEWPMGKH